MVLLIHFIYVVKHKVYSTSNTLILLIFVCILQNIIILQLYDVLNKKIKITSITVI